MAGVGHLTERREVLAMGYRKRKGEFITLINYINLNVPTPPPRADRSLHVLLYKKCYARFV